MSDRKELVRFGKLLQENGYVAATDGTLSVRLDGQSLLVTATSVSKGMMRLQELMVVDREGRNLAGRGRVTSEIAMHLQIYRMRSDVNAVVPAHPPIATGNAATVELLRKLWLQFRLLRLSVAMRSAWKRTNSCAWRRRKCSWRSRSGIAILPKSPKRMCKSCFKAPGAHYRVLLRPIELVHRQRRQG